MTKQRQKQLDDDDSYRIECEDCGAIAYGDPENDVERDKRYHRRNHCPDAEFEVTEL